MGRTSFSRFPVEKRISDDAGIRLYQIGVERNGGEQRYAECAEKQTGFRFGADDRRNGKAIREYGNRRGEYIVFRFKQ